MSAAPGPLRTREEDLDRVADEDPPAARESTAGRGRVRALLRGAGLRTVLGSEVAAAGALLAATLVALLWANLPGATYAAVWETRVSLSVGGAELELDLRHWVNDALMALFFLLISLEVTHDVVLGEFRDLRRMRLPVVGAAAGLLVPALLFVLLGGATDLPEEAVGAWGVVISTDTAFVLGLLAVLGRAMPVNLRAFVLALAVVDDVGALAVIAVVYTADLRPAPLLLTAAGLVVVVLLRRAHVWHGLPYVLAALPVWFGVLASGVHPTVAGVAVGLLIPVFAPQRTKTSAAERAARAYGRSPTSERADRAVAQVRRAVSLNERSQKVLRPWVGFAVVPAFALANAGVALDGRTLQQAAGSGLTWAVVAGLVVGKAIGISVATVGATRAGLGTLPSGVQGRHVVEAGLLSGIGFTLSLFIIDLALEDPVLQAQARIGVLAASATAALLAVVGGLVVRRIDRTRRSAAVRLPLPVTVGEDHVRGRVGAPMELVVYASFAFSTAGRTVEVVDELRERLGDDLVFAFRHALTADPVSATAAQAAEEAERQGRFWVMHDAMAARGGQLDDRSVRRCAVDAGLNLARLDDALRSGDHRDRVARDDDDVRALGLSDPPRAFVNGELYDGPLDVAPLEAALGVSARRDRRRELSPVGAS